MVLGYEIVEGADLPILLVTVGFSEAKVLQVVVHTHQETRENMDGASRKSIAKHPDLDKVNSFPADLGQAEAGREMPADHRRASLESIFTSRSKRACPSAICSGGATSLALHRSRTAAHSMADPRAAR